MVMPNSNVLNNLRDAGDFEIDAWKLLPSLRAQLGDDALNGSTPAKALMLTHVYRGALSRGRELALSTLLYNGGTGPETPPELLLDAFYDYRRPCSAALRNARVATRVGVEGAALTSAQVAGMYLQPRGARARTALAAAACAAAVRGGAMACRRAHAAPLLRRVHMLRRAARSAGHALHRAARCM